MITFPAKTLSQVTTLRLGRTVGASLHPHVCKTYELELIIFSLAQKKYGHKDSESRSVICIKINNGSFDSLRSHKPRSHPGYHKHPCKSPLFLSTSELNL